GGGAETVFVEGAGFGAQANASLQPRAGHLGEDGPNAKRAGARRDGRGRDGGRFGLVADGVEEGVKGAGGEVAAPEGDFAEVVELEAEELDIFGVEAAFAVVARDANCGGDLAIAGDARHFGFEGAGR